MVTNSVKIGIMNFHLKTVQCGNSHSNLPEVYGLIWFLT
ncbi:hypothetical protein LEP1GSC083_4662 [Leptospira interrogans serovar Pyrogenes str. L0374]|uniref:Uncharacterized protein n=2 Tax=Leptospira interrogans serovar Pyrogenes TaxID=280500 RepID=M6ZM68_LEPIR|nr:hypothetical protein LEP1GSC077_4247 [Leptospira interrogans str. C10069]EMN28653.1 hypothetical protein LEP1GSC083_4662 [Leptospira interrogans serovar Pyrogenes str. L0374]EMP07191.1 hypothetical protein LEP1GSC124_3829 [Leptospira interrogans serovar Pyrogenes str. 200701872]